MTNTAGSAVRAAYDGLRKAMLDENGHMKVNESDFLGRLTTVTECSGLYSAPAFTPTAYATTTYGYATLDWLTRVTDTLGNTTAITYDALGRKTGMWDPDMGAWSYAFDDAGNLETQTDAQGQVITFSYDFANRLTGKQYAPTAGMTSVTYTYDQSSLGKGLRTRMDDGSGYTLWSYDARGRVVTETKAISGTGGGSFKTQWTYNPRDLLATQVYPGGNDGQAGETVTTGCDKWGRPATLVGTSNYAVGTDYNALSQIDLLKLGNTAGSPTLQTDYVYLGAAGNFRLQWIKTGPSSPFEGLQKLEYAYDRVGNVSSIKDYKAGGTQTQTFTYDALDRVISATVSGGTGGIYTETYAFNAIGNLSGKGGVAYTYGPTQPHAATAAGSNSYAYDLNGNMITRTVGVYTYSPSYDAENRLTNVKQKGVVTATLANTTTFYAGGHYEQTGSTVRNYYYHAGKRVAMRESSTLYWLLTDQLGSTSQVQDHCPSAITGGVDPGADPRSGDGRGSQLGIGQPDPVTLLCRHDKRRGLPAQPRLWFSCQSGYSTSAWCTEAPCARA